MTTFDGRITGNVLHIDTPRARRIELTLAALKRGAHDYKMMQITADGRVSEASAAKLLGLHPDTLARKRADGTGPAGYAFPIGRAKVSYRLLDLATWIESRRGAFEKIDHQPGSTRSNPIQPGGQKEPLG